MATECVPFRPAAWSLPHSSIHFASPFTRTLGPLHSPFPSPHATAPDSAHQPPPSNKYDRQVRLWGPHGQALLLGSRICLLNASATGTETLKNLVLPGCGHITIVDGADVTQADLSSNFFMTAEYLGRSRAEVRGRLARPCPPPLRP